MLFITLLACSPPPVFEGEDEFEIDGEEMIAKDGGANQEGHCTFSECAMYIGVKNPFYEKNHFTVTFFMLSFV